jgi:DNA-binding transcriptional ArsR family regulator
VEHGARGARARVVGERVDDVFDALADPTRRFVLELLAGRETASQSELAAQLPVTRQAVAKHLSTLRAAGLVRSERRGREIHYALEGAPLDKAAAWLERIGSEWDERLDALSRHVEAAGAVTPPGGRPRRSP